MGEKILFLTNNDNSLSLYHWLAEQGEEIIKFSGKITGEYMKDVNPDIIISYNYKYIIRQEVIDYMHEEVFNLHISFLPWNRGASPNFWSFIEDSPKGVSIHKVDAGLDTGNIVAQKEMFFDENRESFLSTYDKLHDELVSLFIRNWSSIKSGCYMASKQEGAGSFHKKEDMEQFLKENAKFSWGDNIAEYKAKLGGR